MVHRISEFNLKPAEAVAAQSDDSAFFQSLLAETAQSCSDLLGALAGRRQGPLSLVRIDGHSDFRRPGNYNIAEMLGAIAGIDLALATGRRETLMEEGPIAAAPLDHDEPVVQIGEYEGPMLILVSPISVTQPSRGSTCSPHAILVQLR
jgi:arginase